MEWFYVRFGMNENTLCGVTEFFKKTSFLAIAYAGLLVYVITQIGTAYRLESVYESYV